MISLQIQGLGTPPTGKTTTPYPVMSAVFLPVIRAMLIRKDVLLAAYMLQWKKDTVSGNCAGYGRC